jgi:hypothetical protein
MSTQTANIASYTGDTVEARTVWTYHALQKTIGELPEEKRNYVYLNVGEYANYLLRLFAKQNWKTLLEDLTAEKHGHLKNSVTSLLESVKESETASDESTLCGMALRVVQSNLDLVNATSPDSAAVEQNIAETIDRWVKVYNQMIYKGIANA